MSQVAPRFEPPSTVFAQEPIPASVWQFETARRFEWKTERVPQQGAQCAAMPYHDDLFGEVPLRQFVEARDDLVESLTPAFAFRNDIIRPNCFIEMVFLGILLLKLGFSQSLKNSEVPLP